MTKNTPPKHKTPNYRIKTYLFKGGRVHSQWEAMPLRASRKDS